MSRNFKSPVQRVPIRLSHEAGGSEERSVDAGNTLLTSLREELSLYVPSPCGGRGACGLCKVRVSEGPNAVQRLPPCSPLELPWLTSEERAAGVRLSCQLRPVAGLTVRVPELLTAARCYRAEAEEVDDLKQGYRLARFRLVEPEAITFLPGQYLQVVVSESRFRDPQGGASAYRAYSIASSPRDEGRVELLIRLAPNGLATARLWEDLHPGDLIEFNGPHGDFTLGGGDGPLLFVAGGSGVAPVRSMLLALADGASRRPIQLFLVAPPSSLAEELFALRERLAGMQPCLFPPIDASFTERLAEAAHPALDCFLCGGPALVDRAAGVLIEHGVPASRIKVDRFG